MKRFYFPAAAALLVSIFLTVSPLPSLFATAGELPLATQATSSAREEYDAYIAAYNAYWKEADYQKSWDLSNAFVAKYPSSTYAPEAKSLAAKSRFAVYQVALRQQDLPKAFSMGKEFLSESADNVTVLLQLAISAGTAAKRGDFKYQQDGSEYAKRAIQLIEAGQRPNGVSEADWNGKSRGAYLSQLYQISGLFAEKDEKVDDAIAALSKSAEIESSDPVTFYLLGRLHFRKYGQAAGEFGKLRDEYSKMTDEQKVSDAGKALFAKMEALQVSVNQEADALIEAYARVLGMSAGRAEFDAIRSEVTPRLEVVYKYRNNNKTDGLSEKIKSYKPASAATSPGPEF